MTFGRALAALMIALVGCGGGDGNGGPVDPTPPPPPADVVLSVAGGGNNVLDRFSSDLWVHGSYAYTGTWGGARRQGNSGNAVKIWRLDAAGTPALADSVLVPGVTAATVSDVEVSEDGTLLIFSVEASTGAGLYLYSLADPEQPALQDHVPVSTGLHTATLATIAGRRYAFGARNPPDPALEIYDVTDPAAATSIATVPVPATYGIHDTYVRDGIAFVFAWNAGVLIYDVGNGIRGGSPANPVEVSRIVTDAGSTSGGAQAHNGWWFHNPVTGERRYLFVGQEGPGIIGSQSSGDIHVVDVSDLANPREVAQYSHPSAGTHNFWMDEQRQVLYAAYYDAGVIALDVSGELRGDLTSRAVSSLRPGGAGQTYTWGVQLANGWLYAIDMLSGLWQLRAD